MILRKKNYLMKCFSGIENLGESVKLLTFIDAQEIEELDLSK